MTLHVFRRELETHLFQCSYAQHWAMYCRPAPWTVYSEWAYGASTKVRLNSIKLQLACQATFSVRQRLRSSVTSRFSVEWTTQRDSRALLLVLPTTSRHHPVVVIQQVLRADDHDKCFDENTDEKRKQTVYNWLTLTTAGGDFKLFILHHHHHHHHHHHRTFMMRLLQKGHRCITESTLSKINE